MRTTIIVTTMPVEPGENGAFISVRSFGIMDANLGWNPTGGKELSSLWGTIREVKQTNKDGGLYYSEVVIE